MTVRRLIATALDEVARIAGKLADAIDPPRPPVGPQERAASRARHPSTGDRPETLLGTVPAAEEPVLAEVVPFPRPEEPEDGWVACSLGTITATRPIGARVRFDAEPRGHVDGEVLELAPSELSTVRYVIEVATVDGPRSFDLPLSHPLEVRK